MKLLNENDEKINKFKELFSEDFKKIENEFISKGKRVYAGFGYKKFKEIMSYGVDKWVFEQSSEIMHNIDRNRKLVVLSEDTIPLDISNKIMEEYKKSENRLNCFDKRLITEFLIDYNMQSLYGREDDFLKIDIF